MCWKRPSRTRPGAAVAGGPPGEGRGQATGGPEKLASGRSRNVTGPRPDPSGQATRPRTYASAAQLLRRAQQHYPADFWVNHDLGACSGSDAARAGRGGAVHDGRGRLAPGQPRGPLEPGQCPAWKGQLDAAIACYNKAIKLDPKFARAHNNLGIALNDKGQLDEAIASYRKAIELDPKLPWPTATWALH